MSKRLCAAPKCSKELHGRRNQITCSPACRVALHEWRKTPTGRRRERERAARRKRIAAAAEGPGTLHVEHCAVEHLLSRGLVAPESLDAIVTDPPYPREFLPVWGHLGRLAAKALRPGGVLAALSGQAWLPEVLDALRVPGISYRWTATVQLPGAHSQVWPRRVTTQVKPLLVFVRDGSSPAEWLADPIEAPPRARQADAFHQWAQSPGGQDAIVRSMKLPAGCHVLDPFCGGGETALALWRAGCHVVASDVDATAAKVLADSITL